MIIRSERVFSPSRWPCSFLISFAVVFHFITVTNDQSQSRRMAAGPCWTAYTDSAQSSLYVFLPTIYSVLAERPARHQNSVVYIITREKSILTFSQPKLCPSFNTSCLSHVISFQLTYIHRRLRALRAFHSGKNRTSFQLKASSRLLPESVGSRV